MKNFIIAGFLIALAARGCREENNDAYIITKAGDTIYMKDVEAEWIRFKYESDSTMYEADVKLSAAIHSFNNTETKNTLALWTNILRAEQLLERLGEKQELGRQFEEIVNMDEKEFHRMETYKKEYKKLEAKLNQAIEKIQMGKVEK